MITLADIEGWFLSGKPVIRLQWRDFGETPAEYAESLHKLAKDIRLGIAVLQLRQVPGVLVQTFLDDSPVPQLTEPRLLISRKSMPHLFCSAAKCKVRVPFPGDACGVHGG